VKDALASLPGVKNVHVNFDRKQATFDAEAGKYDEAATNRVLQEAGFGRKTAK